MAAKQSAASSTVSASSTRATRSCKSPTPPSAAAISGAASKMMPRLVLRGTAFQLASTASRMRRPTAIRGRQSTGASGLASRAPSRESRSSWITTSARLAHRAGLSRRELGSARLAGAAKPRVGTALMRVDMARSELVDSSLSMPRLEGGIEGSPRLAHRDRSRAFDAL